MRCLLFEAPKSTPLGQAIIRKSGPTFGRPAQVRRGEHVFGGLPSSFGRPEAKCSHFEAVTTHGRNVGSPKVKRSASEMVQCTVTWVGWTRSVEDANCSEPTARQDLEGNVRFGRPRKSCPELASPCLVCDGNTWS